MNKWILTTAASVVALFASSAVAVPPINDPFEYYDTGFYIGDCGDFDVLSDSLIAGYWRYRYDKDGNPTFIRLHLQVTESVYYRSDNPSISLSGGPGEVQNDLVDFRKDRYFFTGIPFKVTVPGYGVIFREVGRVILDLETFEVIFQSGGPHDFTNQNLAALCNALTP